ncbi:NFIL3 like protein [Lissotriton helveticus]
MEGFVGMLEDENHTDIPLGKGSVVRGKMGSSLRRKREFMPDEKKDDTYWEKRRKNNEAAKRSREKRRINDFALESKMMALNEENAYLKVELLTLKFRCGLIPSATYRQQAHAFRSALELYYSRHKSSTMAHSPSSVDPVSPEMDFYTNSCFAPRPTLAESSIVSSPSMALAFTYDDINVDRRKPTSVNIQYNKGVQQQKEHQSAFQTVHPLSFNFLQSNPYCCPTLHETRVSIPKPIVADVDKYKNLKGLLNEPVEDQVKPTSPLLPCDSPPCPPEDCPKNKSFSALPHKLRIKSRSLVATIDNIADTDDREISTSSDLGEIEQRG